MRGTSIPSGTYSSFVGVEEVRSSTRILQNALQLFSSKGYEATSVREICEASGLTKPTLYHFFGSKEGVYRALVEGALQEFSAALLAELTEVLEEAFQKRASTLGADLFRQMGRFILLQVMDTAWVDHLTYLEQLRKGIFLRAYGQKDPLIEFQK